VKVPARLSLSTGEGVVRDVAVIVACFWIGMGMAAQDAHREHDALGFWGISVAVSLAGFLLARLLRYRRWVKTERKKNAGQ
jgi:hypothetical protein